MKKIPIIAIVGQANVGKSSLFNSVLARREAIVAREAGTTRDSISAKASFDGHDFWIVDTAGVKTPEDDFEFTIQEQIEQAADSADVIWVVIEADKPIGDKDRRVSKMALKTKKPIILVVNKFDKNVNAHKTDFVKLGIKSIFLTSTTQNKGISALLRSTTESIPKTNLNEDPDRIKIALLGRPNVGKSQLFNALAKKQQAIVSDRAGTTRDVNHAVIRYEDREIEILDTAGIRRSGRIEKGIEQFSIIRSLAAIEESDVCFLLIDVNEPSVALDQKIAGMVKESGKGLVLVISKWDSLEEKTAFSRDEMVPQIKHDFVFVPWTPLVLTSSVTGQNVTKIFDLTLEIMQQRAKRIKTTELNRWLRGVVDKHPPAGLKNRSPKLNYIVQETDNPSPSFKVFGAHTKFLHWSYKRFMERELRYAYGFEGTTIKFWFIEKHETHKHGVSPTKNKPKRP